MPRPVDGEWLRRWHDQHAGATSRGFVELFDAQGRTTYLRLAAHVGDGDRVLDLACGDGRLLRDVMRRRPGVTVGLDFSAGELAAARARLTPQVELVEGTVQSLPFDDESFDRVLCHMALMLFDDLERVLREIRRVLATGGTLGAVLGRRRADTVPCPAVEVWAEELHRLDFVDPVHIMDVRPMRGELAGLLVDAGFVSVDVEPFDIEGRMTIDETWAWFGETYDPVRLSDEDRVLLEQRWRARVAESTDDEGRLAFRLCMQEIRAS